MYKAKALVGYLLENEAVKMLSNGLIKPDPKILKQIWKEAVDKTQQRGYSNNLDLDIRDITYEDQGIVDVALQKVSKRLQKEKVFGDSWKFKLIEIDKLVSLQKWVNVDVALDLVKNIKDANDIPGAIIIALNSEPRNEEIEYSEDSNGMISISSRNVNLGRVYLGPGTVTLGDENDKIDGVNLTFSCKLSYVVVIHYKGRYILKDGYHRVYGLKSKGFTHIPCILIETDAENEFPKGNHVFPIPLTLLPNPPLFRDYDEVSEDIRLPEISNRIKIKIERSEIIVK